MNSSPHDGDDLSQPPLDSPRFRGSRPRRQLYLPDRSKRLGEQVHEVMRFFHYSRHSELAYWMRLQSGTDIRTVQDLLGHQDVSTTQIYTHVMKRPGLGVVSPLDRA